MKASSTATKTAWKRRWAPKGPFRPPPDRGRAPLDDFFFSPDYRELIGTNREGETGVVVNLDVGREIASLPLPGMPHLGSGISWDRNGHRVVAIPHLNEGRISRHRHGGLDAGQDHRNLRPRLLPAQP
jgi:hypothetical protein